MGFLRVLRFLPTKKVDRVVWVIKEMTDPQKALLVHLFKVSANLREINI